MNSLYNNEVKVRKRVVAVYARVSTEHEAQLSALDNQVQYYDNILAAHPEWTLYKYYIDEGITGTSTRKRKNFLQMMKDADAGRFDLIITREVSRFARNTVDTLQETRKLKAKKIEVWFTEDNIWTMDDEDGELRLTIMATLAQNESKKTSLRVKAGQMISFQNATPYGNGNILGYDKLPNHGGFVINPEQAETVRMIYKWYLEGHGLNRISYMLEQEGRLTATGLTRWQSANVGRILHNAFYCGTIVYRKQYVPDFLEQKKINNFGDVEKIVVEGTHEPIISKEDFAKVQEILNSKSAHELNAGKRPRNPSKNVWCKKLKCPCGGTFNRKSWHKVKGEKTFAYQCYRQIRTGTIAIRQKKGLSIEGICDTPMVPEWKLNSMLMVIFQKFWDNKQDVIKICNEMLEDDFVPPEDIERTKQIQKYEKELSKLNKQRDNLLDLCIKEVITQKEYITKKDELDKKIQHCDEEIARLSESNISSEEERENVLKVIKYGIENDFQFTTFEIPEEVIDAFVDCVIVYPDYFEWHLNIHKLQQETKIEGDLRKAKVFASQAHTSSDDSTGCYSCRKVRLLLRPDTGNCVLKEI